MRVSLLAATLPGLAEAANWGVIAAGSSGFWNYRHQSDACHAYQIMKRTGVPEENIILMMQDDVANDPQNPFPGQLFNRPGNDAVDVYAGCKPAYKGSVVTAELFRNVLEGNATGVPANGPVLKSGPSDKVFVNFVDHGGVGIVAFPNGPLLHASELSQTLKTMQQKKMFQELVFYMEACESGSMFPDLTPNGKILALTASNAQESSWGTYCGADAVVKGKNVGSCLGDLFSVNWMEDNDQSTTSETISDQIKAVTIKTNLSHVMSFGDKSFETEVINNFELKIRDGSLEQVSGQSWDVRDIYVNQAHWSWQHAKSAEEKAVAWKQLQTVIKEREDNDELFNGIVKRMCHGNTANVDCFKHLSSSRRQLNDVECHKRLVDTIFRECPRSSLFDSSGGWNGYNMKFSQILVNACEAKDLLGKAQEMLDHAVRAECVARSSGKESATVVV
jgi:glycosylphosphatidylinositol transamidase (GPIT) subunit GPI8